MRKIVFAILAVSITLFFQYCSSSKKAAKSAPAVTFENSVSGIIETSCGPCHVAGKGNKAPLNNFTAASKSIDEIIARVQKNPGERGFMPLMHDKLPDSTINKLIAWKNAGLKEK